MREQSKIGKFRALVRDAEISRDVSRKLLQTVPQDASEPRSVIFPCHCELGSA